jgi:hypothetical protein
MNKMTIAEAAEKWVDSFNAIPQALLVKAYKNDIDSVSELTKVKTGDNVWSNDYQGEYEIKSMDIENETAVIDVDGEDKTVKIDDLSHDYDDFFPMWGTLWTFNDSSDEDWAENHLQEMTNCGFRIYESDELGIFFGIDGAGYDFYREHWIPLYKARGLQWHDHE